MTHVNLEHLLSLTKKAMDRMTPEEKKKMFRLQAEGWARSEAQWAKDYAEGRCERD